MDVERYLFGCGKFLAYENTILGVRKYLFSICKNTCIFCNPLPAMKNISIFRIQGLDVKKYRFGCKQKPSPQQMPQH